MKLVLASQNKGKLKEMQAILGELGIEVVLQSELGLAVDVEETGTTFAENATLKAKAVMEASGLPAIADDSGLCVDWLQGAPGIYSARYGGVDSDEERNQLLLNNMKGALDRSAHFHADIVCCFPNGDILNTAGIFSAPSPTHPTARAALATTPSSLCPLFARRWHKSPPRIKTQFLTAATHCVPWR